MHALKFDVYWVGGAVLLISIDNRESRGIHAPVLIKNVCITEECSRQHRKGGVGFVTGLFAGAAAHAQRGIDQHSETSIPGGRLLRSTF